METKFEIYKEIFEASQNENRGLTIYFGGQSVGGLVVKIIGTKAVEMRSQMFRRIVIWIDDIDAITMI